MFGNSTHIIERVAPARRSLLAKTLGYRLLSVLVTAVVAFVVLRDVHAALDVGIWANLVKIGVYYGYERAWAGA